MKKYFQRLALALLICSVLPQPSKGQGGVGNNNPTGIAGEYNGSITTAGSYDPYTGNGKRIVDDLTVTGSLGAYPLKWTRVLNTRYAGWSGGYSWTLWLRRPDSQIYEPPYEGPDGCVTYPDGRMMQLSLDGESSYAGGGGELGDRIVSTGNDNYDLLMKDGGRVRFLNTNPGAEFVLEYVATAIIDPYGLTTELIRDAAGRLWRIKEPGGRYLQINYDSRSVQAFDGRGTSPENPIETVSYIYAPWTFNNFTGSYLTRVQYDDGTAATYTYQANNRYDAVYALVKTCHDPRYAGVMKDIEYEYMGFVGAHEPAVGEVRKEKNAGTHQTVSEVIYPTSGPASEWLRRTEKRGDGSMRLFQYDIWGQLASYTDFESHTSSIRYEDPGIGTDHYFKILTDARMHETRIKKDVIAGAVLAVTRGSAQPVRYEYTDLNNPHYLKSKTDENGKVTHYDRDSANRIWRIRYPDNGEETFTYNNFGQVLTHGMTSGGTEVFTYDARGLKTTYAPPATLSDGDPGSHRTIYTYYENEGNRPDRIDRLKSVTDPLGHTTTYDYNKRGQVTRAAHHDGTYTQSGYNDYDDDHDDGTLAWTADENHMGGNENERTRYEYDKYQRVTRVTNPVGKFTSYDYTPVSNPGLGPLSHTTSSVYRVTSHMLKKTEYDYDANFRRKRMTVAPDNTAERATTTYTYDEVGNQITVTEPNAQLGEAAQGPHSTAVYDDHNRRISLTDALGHKTEWLYDDVGNMKKETRADTKFRTWDEYDPMNRVKRTTGFLGAQEVTRYDYDHAGNQTKMTDANGGIYETIYDELNRKTTFCYPTDATNLSRSERWRYDIGGNLMWYKNPAFQFKHFDYDNRNRQWHSYWNSSDTGNNVDQTIGDETVTVFDSASRVTSIRTNGVSASTLVAYGYDEANHKIWEDQTLNSGTTRRVETLPDDDGNRRTLTVAGVYSLTYDYTLRQQLFRINAAGVVGPYFEYTYDKNGNLKKRQNVWQGGGSTNFSYDKGNRVTMCTQFKSSSDPDAFSRTDYNDYDLVNNLKSISREEDQWKGERFEYDDANQLRSASYRVEVGPHDAPQGGPAPGPAETADVAEVPKDAAQEAVAAQEPDPVREPLAGGDAPGAPPGPRTVTYLNDAITRKSMTDSAAGVTTYTPNNLNQYTAVTGHNTPVYDTNFNLKVYDGWTFVYDADKRLISVGGNGHSAQFVYDGLGRCVKRTIDGETTLFTFDEWKPIVEWDSSGTHVAWNLYGPGADEILLRYQYNTELYLHYHLDAMGNVQFLMSANNLGLEKYTYDAFGKPTITTWDGAPLAFSQVGNRFMFTGREYLYTFGIYDYRHRHYHPGLGRFLQTDPIGFKGDPMNLYRYCGGNPINRSDPTGLYVAALTGWGGGDWTDGSGLSAWDRNQGGMPSNRPQAGMGDNADGGGKPKSLSSKEEGKKRLPVHDTERAAADSRVTEIGQAVTTSKKTEWVSEVGQAHDDPTNNVAVKPHPGNGIRYVDNGKHKGMAQQSVVDANNLPPGYKLVGFVLGHVYRDSRLAQKDLNIARDANYHVAIIVSPKRPGEFQYPLDIYER